MRMNDRSEWTEEPQTGFGRGLDRRAEVEAARRDGWISYASFLNYLVYRRLVSTILLPLRSCFTLKGKFPTTSKPTMHKGPQHDSTKPLGLFWNTYNV